MQKWTGEMCSFLYIASVLYNIIINIIIII